MKSTKFIFGRGGALPRTPLGKLTTLSGPLVGWDFLSIPNPGTYLGALCLPAFQPTLIFDDGILAVLLFFIP